LGSRCRALGHAQGCTAFLGEAPNAALAASHVATLRALPPDVVLGTSLFADGDLEAAER